MKLLRWEDLIASPGLLPEPVALSIGVFDGLHLGHRRLIREVARNPLQALAVVITFTRNPAEVLQSRPFNGNLLTLAQKLRRLGTLGIQRVVLIDFSVEFSKLTGKEYLEQLQRCLLIREVVVGYNFHFGSGRGMDAEKLAQQLASTGIRIVVIPPTCYKNETVSSSRIRNEIKNARLDTARAMLGCPFTLDLEEISGIERDGGCFRVPRRLVSQILPPRGDYRVDFRAADRRTRGTVRVSGEELQWKAKEQNRPDEIVFWKRL